MATGNLTDNFRRLPFPEESSAHDGQWSERQEDDETPGATVDMPSEASEGGGAVAEEKAPEPEAADDAPLKPSRRRRRKKTVEDEQ